MFNENGVLAGKAKPYPLAEIGTRQAFEFYLNLAEYFNLFAVH